MGNLQVLGEHLAGCPDSGICIPAPIPHRGGTSFTRDPQGRLWRLMPRIPQAVNLPGIDTQAQAAEVGRALGCFHRLLADLDPGRLAVTLPGFHVTPAYLARLDRVLADLSASRRMPDHGVGGALRSVDQGRPWAAPWSRPAGTAASRSGSPTAIPSSTTSCSMRRAAAPWRS